MLSNQEVRDYARRNGVFLWELAARCGVNDGNFSRKLRQELPREDQQHLMALVDEIASDKRQGVK